MIDKSIGEIINFLHQQKVAHLALSGSDGPWATVVHFINVGLTIYLIEPQAGDLDYYIENNPKVVLTINESNAESERDRQRSVQLSGIARVLTQHEVIDTPVEVQKIYTRKDQQMPGVYMVIEVKPRWIQSAQNNKGGVRRDIIDLDLVNHINDI